jgi:hypothetical protein
VQWTYARLACSQEHLNGWVGFSGHHCGTRGRNVQSTEQGDDDIGLPMYRSVSSAMGKFMSLERSSSCSEAETLAGPRIGNNTTECHIRYPERP